MISTGVNITIGICEDNFRHASLRATSSCWECGGGDAWQIGKMSERRMDIFRHPEHIMDAELQAEVNYLVEGLLNDGTWTQA